MWSVEYVKAVVAVLSDIIVPYRRGCAYWVLTVILDPLDVVQPKRD